MKTRKPHGLRIRGVVGFCMIFTLVFARFSSAQQNFDEESSFEEVATYLEAQIPSEESRKEAATWVEALSSDVFLERQQAEKKLMQSANPPIDELTKAADSEDPELALRAKRLLDHAKSRPRTELHNALRWTHKNPDPRFVATVLKLAAFSKGSIERSLIHRSLQASVNDSHLPALVESSKNDLLAVRSAAVAGLSAIPDTGAADALAEMIEDEEESIRLSSSGRALRSQGTCTFS